MSYYLSHKRILCHSRQNPLYTQQPFIVRKYIFMKASMIMNGLIHLVFVRKDSNSDRAVARVHTVANEPVSVLKETKTRNEFLDEVHNKRYKLNPMTSVLVGI
jgi:hypothetical protein